MHISTSNYNVYVENTFIAIIITVVFSFFQYSCSLVGVSYLQELYSNGDNHRLEVLHSSATSEAVTVEFITSISSSPELEQMGLRNCTLLAKMEDLIASELAGNWHTLKHHVQDNFRLPDKLRGVINRQKTSIEEFEHNVLRRSVSGGDDDKCPEGVCDKEISKEKDDFDVGELFKQYVSPIRYDNFIVIL